MTLSTHAIFGAAVASTISSHPILGFVLAFISHFLLDAIPHWDYHLSSHASDGHDHLNDDLVLNKAFIKDLSKIGLDMLLGLLIVLIIASQYQNLFIPLILGLIAGVLPDFLQFVYMKWRHEPMISLQKFHIWIHAKTDLNNRPAVGITFQVILVVLALVIWRFIV